MLFLAHASWESREYSCLRRPFTRIEACHIWLLRGRKLFNCVLQQWHSAKCLLVFVFRICLSVYRLVKGNVCRQFEHCLVDIEKRPFVTSCVFWTGDWPTRCSYFCRFVGFLALVSVGFFLHSCWSVSYPQRIKWQQLQVLKYIKIKWVIIHKKKRVVLLKRASHFTLLFYPWQHLFPYLDILTHIRHSRNT